MIWLNRQEWKFTHFLGLAVFLRLILLFAVPELSNDFYRFIWDGELINMGINPFGHTPNQLISQGPIYENTYMRSLWHGMGELSQSNYTCYPALNQILFYIPTKFSDSIMSNVIAFKLMLILADIGCILIGKKLLELLERPTHFIWLYALNPFIILEFSGNLHFEGVMIFFLLTAIYFLLKDKWLMSAGFFGFAVLIKLIPLMFLPFLFKKLKLIKSVGYSAMVGFVVIAVSLLFLNEQLYANMMSSINLYFTQFEFNASLIFLIREYSFASVGYNELTYYGPILAQISTLSIVLLALLKSVKTSNDIFVGMLFALAIYYLCSSTVHPWYISTVLALSVFTRYKFALIWSFLIMLSYYAYSQSDFAENLMYVTVEYLVVFFILLIEVIQFTKKDNFGLQLKEFFKLKDE